MRVVRTLASLTAGDPALNTVRNVSRLTLLRSVSGEKTVMYT